MYATTRRYGPVHPDVLDELIRQVRDGFLPLLKRVQGFEAFYVLVEPDGQVVSFTVFRDRNAAAMSDQLSATWVDQHLRALIEPARQRIGATVMLVEVNGKAQIA